MRVAVLFVVSYFSGSKMGGSDNDIIFVSALGKIQARRNNFEVGWDKEFLIARSIHQENGGSSLTECDDKMKLIK